MVREESAQPPRHAARQPSLRSCRTQRQRVDRSAPWGARSDTPRGKKTVDSVNRFREDLVAPLIDLTDLIPGTPDPRDPDAPPYGTWILLYHPGEDGIRCELSLPSGMTSDGTVEGWLVRVMVGTVTDNSDGEPLRPSDDQGGDDVYYGIE